MTTKRRLSASLDASLLDAAEQAVRSGAAPSVSAWVSQAFERQIAHDQRMSAMQEFVADFEKEFGEITHQEIAEVTKRTRSKAVIVRGGKRLVPKEVPPSRTLTGSSPEAKRRVA